MFFQRFWLVSAVCLLFANVVFAQEIQVLKISAEDERATVKTVDGKIRMIKVGDKITSCELRTTGCEGKEKEQNELRVTGSESKDTKRGTRDTQHESGLRVTEISEGRIVFEERTNKGLETVIIRVENGKQKIERISKVPEGGPIIYGQQGK